MSKQKVCHLTALPDGPFFVLLTWLDFNSSIRLGLTCRSLYQRWFVSINPPLKVNSSDEIVWRDRCSRLFKPHLIEKLVQDFESNSDIGFWKRKCGEFTHAKKGKSTTWSPLRTFPKRFYFEQETRLNVLVIGPPKVGKMSLLALSDIFQAKR